MPAIFKELVSLLKESANKNNTSLFNKKVSKLQEQWNRMERRIQEVDDKYKKEKIKNKHMEKVVSKQELRWKKQYQKEYERKLDQHRKVWKKELEKQRKELVKKEKIALKEAKKHKDKLHRIWKREDMKRRRAGLKVLKKTLGKYKRSENWEEEIEDHEENIGPHIFLHKDLNGGKHYRVINTSDKDLEDFFRRAKKKIFQLQSTNKKVGYTLKVKFYKIVNDGIKSVDFHFNQPMKPILENEDIPEIYKQALDFFLRRISETEMLEGSGWMLESIEWLDVKIVNFKPIKGGRGKKKDQHPVPKFMRNCRYFINMRNDDEMCLKWAITRFLNPCQNNQDRITKELREQSEKLNWNAIHFPSTKKDLEKFETLNPKYKLFCYLADDNEFNIFYRSKHIRDENRILIPLILYQHHYMPVTNEKALIRKIFPGDRKWKDNNSFLLCRNCLHHFNGKQKLQEHETYCYENEPTIPKLPTKKKSYLKFEKYSAIQKNPYYIVCDSEANLTKIHNKIGEKTEQYQEHKASAFGCYLVDTLQNKNEYTHCYQSSDLLATLRRYAKQIHEKHKEPKEMPIKEVKKANEAFPKARKCWVCGDGFTGRIRGRKKTREEYLNSKARDHCHYTGKFRGIAHIGCNFKLRRFKKVTVYFHNCMNYDEKLFIRSLKGKVTLVGKNMEEFIGFTEHVVVDRYTTPKGKEKEITFRLDFKDSVKMLDDKLESLVQNLEKKVDSSLTRTVFKHLSREFPDWNQFQLRLRKGVFPYDFVTDERRLNVTNLPAYPYFYNKLNKKHVDYQDYLHAKKVWKVFGCKDLREYRDLYLKIDVLQLADVIQHFRETYYSEYQLDCTQYLTFPALSWDAALKYSGQTLELLTNEQKQFFEDFENGIRGGISTVTHRYSVANNKYMKNYDKNKKSSFIVYCDVNNQYGKVMMIELPVGGFENMDLEKDDWLKIVNTSGKGCYLIVDLEVPKHLHEKFKELPLAPEHRNKKLIPTLLDKEFYGLYGDNLKFYLEEGLVLKKIHRGIKFNTKAWLKGYIENNTRLRTKADNDFEKNLWKKANNAVFGKTMENVRKRRNIRIVTNEKDFLKLASKNTFLDFCHLEDLNPNIKQGVTLVELAKTQVTLNKPIYCGQAILDLSKIITYNFHYNYIKKKYPDEKSQLLVTDTDGLMYHIKTEDFYEDIREDIDKEFDTSNFPKDHKAKLPKVNKKVPGKMKLETIEKGEVWKFAGLRSKQYAYKLEDDEEVKKDKGIKKSVVKNEICFQDYEDALFLKKEMEVNMRVIRSREHKLYSEDQRKKALCWKDDKRIILEDRVSTVPIGYLG